MLPNIRAHSLMVARVSHYILKALENAPHYSRPLPSEELVLAGALLHDIAKTPCIPKGCHHAKKGRDFCERNGFKEVGEVVREHVFLFDFSPLRYEQGDFFAKELVYYGDKRVRHDSIVTIAERLDYILETYGNNDPQRHSLINENFSNCKELEHYLFSHLPITAADIPELVSTHQIPGL